MQPRQFPTRTIASKKLSPGQVPSGIIVPWTVSPWKIPTYNYSHDILGLVSILETFSTDALASYKTRKFHYYLETPLNSKLFSGIPTELIPCRLKININDEVILSCLDKFKCFSLTLSLPKTLIFWWYIKTFKPSFLLVISPSCGREKE